MNLRFTVGRLSTVNSSFLAPLAEPPIVVASVVACSGSGVSIRPAMATNRLTRPKPPRPYPPSANDDGRVPQMALGWTPREPTLS